MVNSRGEPATVPDEGEMLKEIGGRMHGPTSGFIKRYFGDFHYVHQDDTLKIQTSRDASSLCAVLLAPLLPDDFLKWFSNFVSQQLDGAQGSWQISCTEFYGDTLFLLATPISPASDLEIQWDHVQVVGQFYRLGYVCYQVGLSHFCYDVFDVQKDFIQFLSVIFSYQRMADEELGKCSSFKIDKGGSYMSLDNGAMPSLGKLYLERYPFVSRECLNHVVKLKWRCAKERSEDELLKLAKKKGVWGIVSLDHYQELESTANLRRGLQLGTQRDFNKTHFVERQRSFGERQQCYANDFVQCTEDTNDHFQNRIFDCIVTSPIGKHLYTFKSRLELLQVLHNAIKCYRLLYYDAKILHQDISVGNIIIMLIDLDTVIKLPKRPETDAKKTGTRPFMAIGALREESHTYRHDLESFLYVFLWIIYSDMAHDFQEILECFPPKYHSFRPLAKSLHQTLFPLRHGAIWTGTDSSPEATERLYDKMLRAFEEAIASEGG
ncbi:FunK1 protein kinase [Xylaria arbuscula]|nr:FunK1 protein kinase [Xylaria arbuscula]